MLINYSSPMINRKNKLQSHGLNSKVYVPILSRVFEKYYKEGDTVVRFTLDDIREAADELNIVARNPGDVIYRMRSRTELPKAITDKGFYILRQVKRGVYQFEVGTSTIVQIPVGEIIDTIDQTPLPVRRLLPEDLAEIDEQGLLTIIQYCNLLSHFTGLQVFRLKSHVRKGVRSVGQVEVDEVDVGVALDITDTPIVFPIEAKAPPDALNWTQIAAQVTFAIQYFPGHTIRPIAVKVDYDSLIHILEFNLTKEPSELKVLRSATYKLNLSDQQRMMIRQTTQRL